MLYHHKNAIHTAMLFMSKDGILVASYEEIAKAAKTRRRSVARAIVELCNDGLVKRTHGKGRSITNIYEVRGHS